MELTLPPYLINDIEALKEGEKTNSSVLDCLYDELYGSINAAYHGHVISKEQATYLRAKYLGIEPR